MRLFIAIQLNDRMRRCAADIQQSLRLQGVRGNFTDLENLHLTLAFIGEFPDPEPVLDVMETVSIQPFSLTLDGIGHFGDLWWAGLKNSPPLQSVVRRLRRALADADIPFDRKKFSPHITLVRRASLIIPPEVTIPSVDMTVDHITLFRSDRGKNGMIYTELG